MAFKAIRRKTKRHFEYSVVLFCKYNPKTKRQHLSLFASLHVRGSRAPQSGVLLCGSLVDGLLAALLHGCVPGHSEQVVAQSEGRADMSSDKLIVIIIIILKISVDVQEPLKCTCSNIWQRLGPLRPRERWEKP